MSIIEKKALFSLWDDDKTHEAGALARTLYNNGYEIIASGGTANFLRNLGCGVTDTADLTGLKPCLDHRVATLHPALHGGLLAELKHAEELQRLGWTKIDMVVITFYPLQNVLNSGAAYEKVNNAVDIGGPALARSACKGERAVIIDPCNFSWASDCIKDNGGFSPTDLKWMHAVAAARVNEYQAAETRFRVQTLRPEHYNVLF